MQTTQLRYAHRSWPEGMLNFGELRQGEVRRIYLPGRNLATMSATHGKTDVVGLAQQVPALVAGTTSLIGPRVGRVETDERTRLTVSARASVRCRRRPRGARR